MTPTDRPLLVGATASRPPQRGHDLERDAALVQRARHAHRVRPVLHLRRAVPRPARRRRRRGLERADGPRPEPDRRATGPAGRWRCATPTRTSPRVDHRPRQLRYHRPSTTCGAAPWPSGVPTSTELRLHPRPPAPCPWASTSRPTACTPRSRPVRRRTGMRWVDDFLIFDAVRDGRADAGVIFEVWLDHLVRKRGLAPEDVTVVWRSKPFCHCAFTARPGLPDDVAPASSTCSPPWPPPTPPWPR